MLIFIRSMGGSWTARYTREAELADAAGQQFSVVKSASPSAKAYNADPHNLQRQAKIRIAGFDDVIDDPAAFAIRNERAFHRVDRNLFKIVYTKTKRLCSRLEFLHHIRVAH